MPKSYFAKHTVFLLAGSLNSDRGSLLATPGQEFPENHPAVKYPGFEDHFTGPGGENIKVEQKEPSTRVIEDDLEVDSEPVKHVGPQKKNR